MNKFLSFFLVSFLNANNNQILEIIYFNVNKNWFSKNFVKENEIIISGELTKKGKKWQIIHPDHIQLISSKEIIPIYETTYPLTNGLSHKKIKTAITYSISTVPNFTEWINKDLLRKYNWFNFNKSLYNLHFPETKQDIDNTDLYTLFMFIAIISFFIVVATYRDDHSINDYYFNLFSTVLKISIPSSVLNHAANAEYGFSSNGTVINFLPVDCHLNVL